MTIVSDQKSDIDFVIFVCVVSRCLYFLFSTMTFIAPKQNGYAAVLLVLKKKKNNNSQKNKVIAQRVQLPIPVTKSFPKNILNWLEWERLWPYNTEEKRNEEK